MSNIKKGSKLTVSTANGISRASSNNLGVLEVSGPGLANVVSQDSTFSLSSSNVPQFTIGATDNSGIFQLGLDNQGNAVLESTLNGSNKNILIQQLGGNVGIGTTNPITILNIAGTSVNPSDDTFSSTTSKGILRLNGTGGVFMDVGFQASAPKAGWIQTHDGTINGTGDDLLLQPIRGNVGIGTTDPSGGKLHVVGDIYTTGKILGEVGGSSLIVGGTTYQNGNAPTNGMLVEGKVGIGTTSPDVKLHINDTGAIKIPKGTTNQRPSTSSEAQQGYIRYNSTTNTFEGYGAGNTWGSLGGIKDVDGDTYIRAETSPNANNNSLDFFTADSQQMTIDSSGNVGIGTTSPATLLEISGNSVDPTTATMSTSSSQGKLRLTGAVNGIRMDMGTALNSPFGGWIQTHNGNSTDTVGEVLLLQPARGNVGIGTDDPGYKLEVVGQVRATQGFSGGASSTFSGFTNSGTITTTGNVGIGTTSPGTPLTIVGAPDTLELQRSGKTGKVIFQTPHSLNDVGLAISTGGSTPTEKFRITPAGNVGIGNSTPEYLLDLADSTYATATPPYPPAEFIRFSTANATGNSSGGLIWKTNFGSTYTKISAKIEAICEADSFRQGLAFFTGSFPTSTTTLHTTDATEKMRIDMDGKVGIGTTAPRCTLNTHNTIASGDNTIPQYTGDIDGNKSCDLFLGKSADSGDNYWGMWMGTPYESPWGSYIQCGAHNAHYPLNLNPHGGIVNIGTGGIINKHFYMRSEGHKGALCGGSNGTLEGGTTSADYRSNPIYIISDAYHPSSTTLTGSGSGMYGIGYSHTNASFLGAALATGSGGGGWGMYVAAGGDARIWFNGSTGGIDCKTLYVRSSTSVQNWAIGTNRYATAAVWGNGNHNWNSGTNYSFSAVFWNSIAVMGSYIVHASDRRIKENIIDVDDTYALTTLRNIPVRYYNYIDKVNRGNHRTIGFIAQEVREVLPEAISLRKSVLPNIMLDLSNISWETITNDTGDKTYKLISQLQDVSGINHKFVVGNDISGNDEEEKEVFGNSDNTFTFTKKYNHVFCIGREVDDFHTIDKNKLFTINFSATQEIDRLQQQEIIKVQTLQTDLSTANTTIQSHETTIQQQATKITTLETQIADILSRLSVLENSN